MKALQIILTALVILFAILTISHVNYARLGLAICIGLSFLIYIINKLKGNRN